MIEKMDRGKATILVADDMTENIDVLNGILSNDYVVKVATSGAVALEIAAAAPQPDLILLDVMMPEMDGYEVCRKLKDDIKTRRIPVIFVTALDQAIDEARGFETGAVDYITKPVSAPIVRARVKTHLMLYDQNRGLDQLVRERTLELQDTRLEIIQRLGKAAEYKDDETGRHIIRMSHYCRLIALQSGLGEDETDLLFNAAPMHDIGKIGIPDSILQKPGKLDREEWAIMQTHAEKGGGIIGEHPSDLLKAAKVVALTHHEKWNGAGYPKKLKGRSIPLYGRIAAIADVFDALTSKRPYKDPWPVEKAVEEIENCAGSHFDPGLVPHFLGSMPAVLEVMGKYGE